MKIKPETDESKVQYSRKGQCIVEGCDRDIEARQLCEKHYARMRRRGSTHAIKVEPNSIDQCLAPGCTKQHYSSGYCRNHNYTYKKVGYPYMAKVIKLCGGENCSNFHFLMGLCVSHFIEWETNLKKFNLTKQIKKN